MKKQIICLLIACFASASIEAQTIASLASPNKLIEVKLIQSPEKQIQYQVFHKSKEAIAPSSLGFTLKKPAADLRKFTVIRIDSSTFDQTWSPLLGEVKDIRNQYSALSIELKDAGNSGITIQVHFRIYDDGIGFRYTFPKQDNLNHFIVDNEWSTFKMTGDHTAFWIPGDYDTNEYTYNKSKLSEIDASTAAAKEKDIALTAPIGKNFVQSPLMLKSAEGLYINVHEAALLNYPVMHLQVNGNTLTSQLTPDAVGNKAYLQSPFSTPWRTLIITDKAEQILASKLILNLNEPSKIKDSSWIKGQKFVGMWWEMHVGKANWPLASGKHGANTANVKRYIDFAAQHGFDGVLVEGWNQGWEDWFGNWKENVFDFTSPYPDYDIDSLTKYAQTKGLRLIMHHETSGSVTNYERRMDAAYTYMVSKGINTVKTGYVGRIIPRGEHHDSQWMTQHYQRVAEKAADYKLMVDSHESSHPTGLHRTYPNWLSSEAARGSEFNNAPTLGIVPNHTTILPFTRLIGGPMDYTPGLFHLSLNQFDTTRTQKVRSTLAKQLALYVTIYSPLQMAADLPENYEQHLDAFQFIKDVPVNWDDTKIISAEPGEYVTIARKAKGKDSWFIGSITNENARNISFGLDFLDADKTYEAIVYRDADTADFEKNPEAYIIEKRLVTRVSNMTYRLQRGGGCAVSLKIIN
jgi:glucan 1,4-alpha-glucosidase